jgi:hypothetical protein
MQCVPKFVPITSDTLKEVKPLPFRARKTGKKSHALTPIDEATSEPDNEASRKTNEAACPEHVFLRSMKARIMLHCGGDIATHSVA